METTHYSPLALSYANSLIELAEEQNITGPIAEELTQVGEILDENPSFKLFLSDPAISMEERSRVLRDVFAGKVTPLLWNFLGVLIEKGRTSKLHEIIGAFDQLMDEKHGKIEVDVTVAQRLSAEDLENVRQRISQSLKKDAVVHQYVDESIIGGMLLRVQDQLIDASVRGQLQDIKTRIMASKPK